MNFSLISECCPSLQFLHNCVKEDSQWRLRLLNHPLFKLNAILSPPASFFTRFKSEWTKERGNKRYEARDVDATLAFFLKALEIDPTHLVLYSNLSACYALGHRFAEAQAMAEKAIEVLPLSHSFFSLGPPSPSSFVDLQNNFYYFFCDALASSFFS